MLTIAMLVYAILAFTYLVWLSWECKKITKKDKPGKIPDEWKQHTVDRFEKVE